MQNVLTVLKKLGDPTKALTAERFFKTGTGEYGEGDRFLGITMPELRRVAKAHETLPLRDLKSLLRCEWHEARMLALLVLIRRFDAASERERDALIRFYLRHRSRVNNWDLVDVSAPPLLGTYLLTRNRTILNTLAKSGDLWSERIAMVSTLALIRAGETRETFRLAKRFLTHPHDLMHKAAGWMLREAGKKDLAALRHFLDRHAPVMPRTMLRYAIERLSSVERKKYLSLR